MRPFDYIQPHDAAEATRAGAATGQGEVDSSTQYLAGGTTLLDLMKLDVLRPSTVVDISSLKSQYGKIEVGAAGLRLGAMVSMAAAGADPAIAREYPAVAQSLLLAASAQLRNMATLGGNVAHALPAGDGTTSLVALDAEVEIFYEGQRKWLPVEELGVG